MTEILSWLLFMVSTAGLLVVGVPPLRGYLFAGSTAGVSKIFGNTFFAQNPVKRLDGASEAAVDDQRFLVPGRRDYVEHLIMTGGPVDFVIEPEKHAQVERLCLYKSYPAQSPDPRSTGTFGQAISE